MHLPRLLTLSVSAVCFAACSSGRADQPPKDESTQTRQAVLPQNLCDLSPQPDAERIMGKALVQRRNDASGCHYQDARGTGGTSLWTYTNVLTVSDQCRMTPGSVALSGVGDEACIAVGHPGGLYTTVVFGSGGQTFEVAAPGRDKASELATPVAKLMLSKLGS